MEKVKEPNRRIDYENGSDRYSVRLFSGLKNDQKNRPLDQSCTSYTFYTSEGMSVAMQ